MSMEALKKEVETLEAKKTQLVGEVGGLRTIHAELEEFQKKVDLLNKEVDDAKAVEQLVAERALKATEVADILRKEVDAERESGTALKGQVDMFSMCL